MRFSYPLQHSKFLVRYSIFEFRISNLVAARGRARKSVVSFVFNQSEAMPRKISETEHVGNVRS